MDFTFSEEQDGIRGLADQIFQGQATVERVKAVEASDERIDRALWGELAKADLLGLALPEADGGSGYGMVELCLLLEQQGRVVAPVPLLWTVAAAMAIAESAPAPVRGAVLPGVVAGDTVLSVALEDTLEPVRADGDRLTGARACVPYGHVAEAVLVPTDEGLWLVDLASPGVERDVLVTTNREKQAHLRLDGAPATRVGGADATAALRDRVLTGLCALQVGVAEAALAMAAEYTSNRRQFDKPLSTFQGVALKAADAYIATESMRATLWQAAWLQAEGLEHEQQVLVAKWWASEGGQQVVHITQHLHGGMGADVDYPVHRYFLWGKQIEDTLGGATVTLVRLGAALAAST